MKKIAYVFWGVGIFLLFSTFLSVAYASHSWGGYHWARTKNPFTLKLGNNISSVWNKYLATASTEWSLSSVLDTSIVPGQSNPKNCRATLGQVEVCNNRYGNNNWLGIASIWVNGSHIVQGTAKFNDTYFNTTKYNTSAWRNLVVCQEVAHIFGLDHQDENFLNPNLGTCMDYTNDPDGSIYHQLDNQYPNAHDYEELEIIYGHLDNITTIGTRTSSNFKGSNADVNDDDRTTWGKEIRKDRNGHSSLFERDEGKNNKIFTFVFWAN